MSWNYRIVKYADGTGYGLHEVHYELPEKAVGMTDEPAGFCGETPEEIQRSLSIAMKDAMCRAIFDEPQEWRDRDESETNAPAKATSEDHRPTRVVGSGQAVVEQQPT